MVRREVRESQKTKTESDAREETMTATDFRRNRENRGQGVGEQLVCSVDSEMEIRPWMGSGIEDREWECNWSAAWIERGRSDNG